MDSISWPSDCSSRPLGKLTREAYGGTLDHTLHWNTLEQKLTIIWGTWESNPGPSVCKTRPPPLSHLRLFVTIINQQNNI